MIDRFGSQVMGHNTRGPARLLGTALLPLAAVLNLESPVSTPKAGEGTGYYGSFRQWMADCTEVDASFAETADPNYPLLTTRRAATARDFSTPIWHGGVQCGQLHGRTSACPTMDRVLLETFWEGAARQGRVSDSSDSARSPGSGGSGRASGDSGDSNTISRTNSFGR
jgi:hypothetical protein